MSAVDPHARPPGTQPVDPVVDHRSDSAAAIEAAARRRAIGTGITWLVVALGVLWIFALGSTAGAESSFELSDDVFLTVPTRLTCVVLALLSAALAVVQLVRGFPRTGPITMAVALLAVLAFLTYVTRSNEFSLFGMFQSTVTRATPLALGALAGVLCERSGVVNIAIEGMMLFAAFTGTVAAAVTGNLWVGMLFGIVGGALLAWGHAALSVTYRVDQIISGTAINFFATGITSYLAAAVLTSSPELNRPGTFSRWRVPLLGDIPFVGDVLFDNNVYVYLTMVLLPFVTWMLFRSRWGLRVRAVGEHPRAADTVGIRVLRTRYHSVILGGMAAGLAGSFLTIGSTGSFVEDTTAGRGFIALAIMIFGRWNPLGALAAALLFGFTESLNSKLAILGTPIPSEFLLMAPYVVTLFVVAGFGGRARPPAADGQPYETD